MEPVRKPFQGVSNIIRFNRHLYFSAIGLIILLVILTNFIEKPYQILIHAICILIIISIVSSLLTSLYIYDLSDLYKLKWLSTNDAEDRVVTINSGFDETSHLLKEKFKKAEILALDFYNPETHTEISIKRAREFYPPFPNTKQVKTSNLLLEDNCVDKIIVMLSAHEIRDDSERMVFFNELRRIIKPKGQIYVTEHLRDLQNFAAYNIGFFHFFSKRSWLKTFSAANLKVEKEIKITPFISTFILIPE